MTVFLPVLTRSIATATNSSLQPTSATAMCKRCWSPLSLCVRWSIIRLRSSCSAWALSHRQRLRSVPLSIFFTTRAVAVDEKALGAFINADLLQRRKLINKARQHDHTNLELREATTDEFIERLEQEIKASGAKPLKVEDLSKLAGMHDWYTTCYSLLSSATHTNVRELDDYLSRDQAGEIRSLTYAPAMKEIPDLLLTAAHCILLGTVAVSQTFAVDFQAKGTDHLKCIEAEFASLGANTERST